MKWNNIVLAAKAFLFHFRCHSWNETKNVLAAKTILFDVEQI